MIVVYCFTKQMKTFSIDKIMTTESGKFKGPPSAPEWTIGSAGRRYAVRGDSLRRQVDVHMCTRNMKMEQGQGSMRRQVRKGQSCEGLKAKCTVESVKA